MRGGTSDNSDISADDNVGMCGEWRREGGRVANEYVMSSRLDIWDRLSIPGVVVQWRRILPGYPRRRWMIL